MAEPEPEESGKAFDRAVDQHIGIFFRDPTLWPVLVVAFGAVVTLGGAMLVFAFGERNPFALAALAVMLVISGDLALRDLRRRRFGLASRALLGLWCGAAGGAFLAVRLGIA